MGRISKLVDGLVTGWTTPGLRRGVARPPVSAVISASVFDVPYLAVTLPHLLRQSRFSFAERLVVLDPRRPEGARRRRAHGRSAELERIVNDAKAAGIIDRVIELDPSEAARRTILERYFDPRGDAGSSPEGLIHAALFGLEAARHDLVAWFDADLLFHASPDASGAGWVTTALGALAGDRDVWLMTTRSGPPQAWRAPRWARALALLGTSPHRVRTGSPRHFLCDRRRLHRKLGEVPATTEQIGACVTHALAPHQAFLGIVDASWHLHPRSHGPPFPHWIQELAGAVERGEVPAIQRDGCLRLDDPASRSAWRTQLFAVDDGPSGGRARVAPRSPRAANLVERRAVPGTAPVSIVIPIRDRAGSDVRNALASLAWQTSGPPWEVIIVSHGSDPVVDAELRSLAVAAGATLITVGDPADPWCKPLALNTGIQATDPAISFVMTMDGDMILAENMLDTVLAELRGDPQKVVLCQSSDLPQDCVLPADPAAIRAQFARLAQHARVRGTYGTGGIQAVRRSFLFEVHGYDEDMLWWGALDTDLVRRAESRGLRASWITDRSAMLHQWHPRKQRVLDDAAQKQAAQLSWLRNHELMLERANDVVRNHDGWGAVIASGPLELSTR